MLTLELTSKFRKDFKKAKKRGLDMSLLLDVVNDLLEEKTLDEKYLDHALTGNYKGFRECHLQPDWLFVYKIDGERLVLVASRTGTHSDLFE